MSENLGGIFFDSLYIVKTAAQSHYRKTIGLKQSARAIVVR